VGDRYLDQAVLSGHSRRDDDLDRFIGLGICALRYPLLWERFAGADEPDRLWAWHDARIARLVAAGVRPILGLIHHGSGPPTTGLLADDFASGLAAHAALAAARYPQVRDWTPVNEPLTTARFSALYGHWYPHRRDERDFWLALLNQVDATRLSMVEIRARIPGARLIQTEDLGHTAATPERAGQAAFDNERRWASWDLLAGRMLPDHPMWNRLVDLGFEDRLRAIGASPCVPDVLGLNHYLTSDRFLDHRLDLHPATSHGASVFGPLADVEAVRVLDQPAGVEGAVRACWARYGLPVALTEIHNGCTREEQMRWLLEAWETAGRLRDEGIAIEAVTAWSLLGAHDWDSLLTRDDGRYESGVFDVRGGSPRETALAPLLRQLASGAAADHPVLARTGWWRGHAHRAPPARSTASRPLLIVGASGTLGQAFAGACRLRGIDHILTGRDTLDLDDPISMARALGAIDPWAVINCAGWVRVDAAEAEPDACFAANCTGSIALAQACAARDLHYSCFSSDLVFDGLASRPYVESDAVAPLSVYGHSKAKGDARLRAAGGRVLIIRTASFFSPYDRQNFAVHAAAALSVGAAFPAASDCITSPTYVPDLVRATLDLVIDDATGLWHLVSDGARSWADFAVDLGDALGLPTASVEPRPASAMGWAARRPHYAPLTSERGLIMPSLGSAIERFAAVMAG
jgi:dTDP-4-dehydrorhamnose reductase